MDRYLSNILDNHFKLISMINAKTLPIKTILLNDVQEIKSHLEKASRRKENEQRTNE